MDNALNRADQIKWLFIMILVVLALLSFSNRTKPEPPDWLTPAGQCQHIVSTRFEGSELEFDLHYSQLETAGVIVVNGLLLVDDTLNSYICVLDYNKPLAGRVLSLSTEEVE